MKNLRTYKVWVGGKKETTESIVKAASADWAKVRYAGRLSGNIKSFQIISVLCG